MIEFFSVMFRAVTGMKLTLETLIFLGFIFMLGWLFGKLTRRIGIIKGILLGIFGSAVLAFLSVAPGVFVITFLAGVLTNHGPILARVIFWAQDLADFFYALKYRRAYEDIRAEEAKVEEELRNARAEAYKRAHAFGDSSSQERWRKSSTSDGDKASQGEGFASSDEEKATNDEKSEASAASFESAEQTKTRSPSQDPVRRRHLEVLGLDASGEYTQDEIKKAYRKRAKETHPDAGGDAQEFIDVRAAWKALSQRY